MFEIFKELLERPEKTKRYFLFLVHWVFVGILTSEVYVSFFGAYDILLFSDTNFWKQVYFFIFSGKAMLVLFLLFGMHYIIDFCLTLIFILLDFCFNRLLLQTKVNVAKRIYVKQILKVFKVLEKDQVTNSTLPGVYFAKANRILESNSKESLLDDIGSTRHSLLMEIFGTLLLFSLVYFFVFSEGHFVFSVLIVVTLCVVTLLVLFFSFMSAFIQQYYDVFADIMRLQKQVQVVDAFLANHAIQVLMDNKYNHSKLLQLGEAVYFLQHYDFNTAFKDVISSFSDSKEKVKVVLLLHKPLPLGLYAAVKEYPELTLLTFTTEEKLVTDLEDYFKKSLG